MCTAADEFTRCVIDEKKAVWNMRIQQYRAYRANAHFQGCN